MIKWIISDMDGTLLIDHNRLPGDFDEVMSLMKEHGIMFSPASGRQYQALASQFAKYKDELLFISENGTYVCRHGEELFSSVLPKSAVDFILGQMHRWPDISIVLSGKHGGYVTSDDPVFHREMDLYYTHYKMVKDFSEIDDEIIKIAICDSHQRNIRPRVYDVLKPACKDAQVVLSNEIWVDIVPLGASKGTAIRQLQKDLGIKPEECAAFGDYLNDKEMLESVYYSYAMGDAIDEIKQTARFITAPHDQNAVMDTIRKLIAENK